MESTTNADGLHCLLTDLGIPRVLDLSNRPAPGTLAYRLQLAVVDADTGDQVLLPRDLDRYDINPTGLATVRLLLAALAPPDTPHELGTGRVHRRDGPTMDLLGELARHSRGMPAIGIEVSPPGLPAQPTAHICAVEMPAGWPVGDEPRSTARRWLEVELGRQAALDWLRDNGLRAFGRADQEAPSISVNLQA